MTRERRARFEKGKQRELIINAAKNYGSLKNLAYELKIPYRTLKGYAQEERSIPERLFEMILERSSIQRKDLKISYLPSNWGAKLGGTKGMRTLEKKYPKELVEWRKKALRKSHLLNTKPIKFPRLDEKLAEFIGVYLGDGTITKYFVKISGDKRYDIPYFFYLSALVSELFGVSAKIRKDKGRNTVNLIVQSKKVCSYLNKNFNIKYGHKIRNKSRIPKKILKDKKLSVACMRGLIDTDGSISRRGRKGSQFCIQFTSHNKYLLEQVHFMGRELGFFTYGDKYGAGTNKWSNIVDYFRVVGSSNLRHIVRFYERFKHDNTIYQKDVLRYYQKPLYNGINLPFKLKSAS